MRPPTELGTSALCLFRIQMALTQGWLVLRRFCNSQQSQSTERGNQDNSINGLQENVLCVCVYLLCMWVCLKKTEKRTRAERERGSFVNKTKHKANTVLNNPPLSSRAARVLPLRFPLLPPFSFFSLSHFPPHPPVPNCCRLRRVVCGLARCWGSAHWR